VPALSGLAPVGTDASASGYLLSHHHPQRYSRTLLLPLGRRNVRVCARCSGQAIGVVLGGVAVVLTASDPGTLFNLRVMAIAALLPLPAAVDWITQSIGRRESSNRLRLVSGAGLGFAGLLLVATLVTAHWEFFFGGLFVAAVYVASLAITLRVSGAWIRVVEEHFPGL
jgi:uncharacterized membrane protein